ncbi:MAG TPA: Hsp20/alpha crystallin family protein [Alphaproteobacteria bacterium]|nr:Hsp20/alpha crystallin family protein [Alphaproteobacteria bacterium]
MIDPFEALRSQIDRIFNDFSRGIGFPRGFWDDGARLPFGWSGNGTTPSLDMYEADGKVMISAELPGVDEQDIDISVHDDTLTISGEKKSEFEHKEGETYRSERSYGRFSRSVRLPFQIDPDKVEARYDKGVLKLTIDKPAEAMERVKKIPLRH